jgi:TRAP-type C4-dicarboxylate transport system permease small subunit
MNNGLLSRIELIVGFVLLAVIVVLVFAASVMRFFGHPLIWSVDFSQLLFIWLCFLGANRALRKRAHLGVDILVRYLGRGARLVLESALALLVVAFLLALAYEGTKLTFLNLERLFGDSGIPYAFVTIAVPVGAVFLSLTVIVNTIQAIRHARNTLLVFTRTPLDEEAGL